MVVNSNRIRHIRDIVLHNLDYCLWPISDMEGARTWITVRVMGFHWLVEHDFMPLRMDLHSQTVGLWKPG